MKTSETGRGQDQDRDGPVVRCEFPLDGVLSVWSRQWLSDLWGAVGVGITEGNTSPLASFLSRRS
jgi:hypothetical protein